MYGDIYYTYQHIILVLTKRERKLGRGVVINKIISGNESSFLPAILPFINIIIFYLFFELLGFFLKLFIRHHFVMIGI